ncbi:MAG: hypothetical protein GY807_21890 [Gammaproteobacteria bacterium]|nr:hypothetical protein [Gammaproteobacteria bacterium]
MKTEALDNFTDLSAWSTVASGQAQISLSADRCLHSKAMRVDFDFKGSGGFVVARKAFSLTLPEAYAFRFKLRGSAPANKFEFKLIDPDGNNVWRYQEDPFDFDHDWRPIEISSSQIEFAWGPAGGGPVDQVGAIEFVIAAGPGGKGTLWISDLCWEDRTFRAIPVVQASSELPDHKAIYAVDRSANTSWRSELSDKPQWFVIDFGEQREYGGMIVHWEPATRVRRFDVETSNDANQWKSVYCARHGSGEHNYIYLPKSSSRLVRLNLHPGEQDQGIGIVDIDIKPYDFSRTINDFFRNITKDQPKGHYPKYLYAKQTYWTPAGIPDGVTRGIMNEEGMVEVDEGSFSLEPFLYLDEQLITWADVCLEQTLEHAYLPIPSSLWQSHGAALKTTAFATDDRGKSVLYVRYRLENKLDHTKLGRFFVAIRPFQVTPPWQSFRDLGGISQIKALTLKDGAVWVNRDKVVIPLDPPKLFGATTFDQGGITKYLERGVLPTQKASVDDFGHASAALCYEFTLAPGAAQDIYIAVPFGSHDETTTEPLLPEGVSGAEQFEIAVRQWQRRLSSVNFQLPSVGRSGADTFQTAVAHILVNREESALQPGPRRYTRSWIRDGATMAAALLRAGCTDEIRDYMRWYAQYLREDGFVPCCVDRDGPDWLPEYDSQGEFIYTIMEYYRFTRDHSFLIEMWPAVLKTVDYLEILRKKRLTPEFETAEKRACYGLLPESASHEGYLAHPVHAYWDDFWALRGLKDAATMAKILGHPEQTQRLSLLRDSFQGTLYASIKTTIADRSIDFIPGSVEWADFDATATANAIALLDEAHNLPESALNHTFDEYFKHFRKRCRGEVDWLNYTPYEIRIIGALIRLGWREKAVELLEYSLNDRRPPAWNQWPEIAWRDPKAPGHMGDLPHTWIAAEYVLAFRSLFAFERDADQALVIAAGIPDAWLMAKGGVAIHGLPTWYGTLNYSLMREQTGTLHMRLSGDLRLPPGKIILQPPGDKPLREVLVNAEPIQSFTTNQATIETFPAEVVVRY